MLTKVLSISLSSELKKESTIKGKLLLLEQHLQPESLAEWPWIEEFWPEFSNEERLALLSFMATGQGLPIPIEGEMLHDFLEQLIPIERFYAPIGGILGYHQTVCFLLERHPLKENMHFHVPPAIDLSYQNKEIEMAVIWGIKHLDKMAELYPIGGAADRLGLKEEKSGNFLPAALLEFYGKTLLEYLLADLQAREYLYYKLFGKQLTTPIGVMTSPEKENHDRIVQICENHRWFGRPRESFRFFIQPLVPTLNTKGNWIWQGPLQLLLKPGGHGVIWQLAEQEGIFDWLASQDRPKALIRQINNIIAGVDDGLLGFIGIGCKKDARIGFASCSRFVHANEGINVLVEKLQEEETSYCLTNIEYCDFDRYNLKDERANQWNPYSKYPANTNLLFVDLQAIREAVSKIPFPGMLVNAKNIKFLKADGQIQEEQALRLESTMQNIADCFTENRPSERTYLTYNLRHKTISPIKRVLTEGAALSETPEGHLYDSLYNARELLVKFCKFAVPELPSEVEFQSRGPSFLFVYHPALGPLYSLIGQKVQKGSLTLGSELHLEIADLQMENVHIEGSLRIRTNCIMGSFDQNGLLQYGRKTGKCRLKNVHVFNKGFDSLKCSVWKEPKTQVQCCEIFLGEGAEFEAENIELKGHIKIHVPDGMKIRAVKKKDKVEWIQQSIESASWEWAYSIKKEKILAKLQKMG